MNTYNGYSARNSFTAAVFTVLFSVTCLVGALGPAATNASPDQARTVIHSLA